MSLFRSFSTLSRASTFQMRAAAVAHVVSLSHTPVAFRKPLLSSTTTSSFKPVLTQVRAISNKSTQLSADQSNKSSPSTASTSTSTTTPSSPASSTTPSTSASSSSSSHAAPTGVVGKIQHFVREYGAIGVCTYLGIYVGTLGMLFVAVHNKLLPFDPLSLIKFFGLDHYLSSDSSPTASSFMTPQNAAEFTIAWILTKLTEPIRFALTIFIAPRLSKIFKKKN